MVELLLRKISDVLTVDSLAADVTQKITEEELTLEQFRLLRDDDLQSLGFKMGARRMLMNYNWSSGSMSMPSASVQTASVETPTTSQPMSPREVVSEGSRPTRATLTCDHLYPVEDILNRIDKGVIKGSAIVDQLKRGNMYDRQQRIFFVKSLGRYLMRNALEPDRPSKLEKTKMALSIVTAFPVLKEPQGNGYESFFDSASFTGFLEHYIRQRRSRCADITTMWRHPLRSTCVESSSPAPDAERMLKERRPNAVNGDELLRLMNETRSERRRWIIEQQPSVTSILQRYPRFIDMNSSLRQEFTSMNAGQVKTLRDQWSKCRENILQLAKDKASSNRDLQQVLDQLTDENDEDMKTHVSFSVLPFLLPSPPKRGVKRQKPSPSFVLDKFYRQVEDDKTVDEAVELLKADNCHQPLLFRLNKFYYIKCDQTAIPITEQSCFADVVEYLFMCFFVFNVKYPDELRLVYGFLEQLVGLPSSIGKSPTLATFMRDIRI